MKKCSRCNIEYDYYSFYKDKSSKDGLRSNCKECSKKYREETRDKQKEYREKNKEKINKDQRDNYNQSMKVYSYILTDPTSFDQENFALWFISACLRLVGG